MSYLYIQNPVNGRDVNIYTKTGQTIIKNYIYQLGGHKGPCAINGKTGRCKKSAKGDGYCLLENGRCKKIIVESVIDNLIKQPTPQFPPSASKALIKLRDQVNRLITLSYSIPLDTNDDGIRVNDILAYRPHNAPKWMMKHYLKPSDIKSMLKMNNNIIVIEPQDYNEATIMNKSDWMFTDAHENDDYKKDFGCATFFFEDGGLAVSGSGSNHWILVSHGFLKDLHKYFTDGIIMSSEVTPSTSKSKSNKQSSQKYTVKKRKSPSYSANKCPEGMVMKGNDGEQYCVSKPNKKGVKSWRKVK